MKYELFGTAPTGEIEYLGTFFHMDLMLEATDQYSGMGYESIKFCESVDK